MSTKKYYKKALGIIVASNMFAVLLGFVAQSPDRAGHTHTFMYGYIAGMEFIGIILLCVIAIYFFGWCFED